MCSFEVGVEELLSLSSTGTGGEKAYLWFYVGGNSNVVGTGS